jgi:hypothetical protein
MSTLPCHACHGSPAAEGGPLRDGGRTGISARSSRLPVGEALAFFETLEPGAPAPGGDRRAPSSRKSGSGCASSTTSASLPDPGAARPERSPVARRSASGSPRRSGAALVGVLYILDEPSIGLHQRDNDRLLGHAPAAAGPRQHGLVVEHDEDTIRAADWIVDLGPGAGGTAARSWPRATLEDVIRPSGPSPAAYLRGEPHDPVPVERRPPDPEAGPARARGAREQPARHLDVELPARLTFTCVTGVSGRASRPW